MGFLSDRLGRRPLLIASTLGGAVGYFLQGTLWTFWWNVLARFLTGLFSGSRPVVMAYIADAVPEKELPIYMGYIGLCVTFSMQFGPVLGGSLSLVSYRLPMLIAGGMSFVLFVLVTCCLAESHGLEGHGGNPSHGQDDGFQSNAALEATQEDDEEDAVSEEVVTTFRWVLVAAGLVISALGSYLFAVPLLMADEYNLNPNEIGLLQWGDGVVIVLGSRLYSYLIDKWSLPQIGMLGAVAAIVQVGIPLMPSLLTASMIRYPGMLIGPTVQPALSSIIAMICPRRQRGGWLATFGTVQSFMRALTPLFVGIAYDKQHWLAFALTASCCLPLIAVLYVLDGRLASEPLKEAILMADRGLDDDAVYDRLCMHYDKISALLARPDQIDESLLIQPHTEEQGQRIGGWLAAELEIRGYKRWHEPDILPAVQALIMNALPAVAAPTRLERIGNVLRVYETHMRLNREIKAAQPIVIPLLHTGMTQ